MKHIIRKSGSNDSNLAPIFPTSGTQLFERLRIALTKTFGYQPTFEHLAQMLGESLSTTHHWFTSYPNKHVIAFLVLIERLPERKRIEFISECCRELPSLDNPRLAHDQLGVSKLECILKKPKGLTWICGGTEFHRTLLITALGHSYTHVTGSQAGLCGVSIHEPRKWVPLENVIYCKELLEPAKLRDCIIQAWPQIRSAHSGLVLLNEIWSLAPHLEGQILDMTNTHHVVVTDAMAPDLRKIAHKIDTQINIIKVSPARENERWIRFEIETA